MSTSAPTAHDDEFILDDDASTGRLVATGIFLGVVHVLAGPDHVAAIATLSAGNTFKAFFMGIQWGFGHSIGLIFTAILFLTDVVDIDSFGRVGEPLVGGFMILLACYSFMSIFRQSKVRQTTSIFHEHQDVEVAEETPTKEGEKELILSEDNVAAAKSASVTEEGKSRTEIIYARVVAITIGIIHGVAGPGGVLGVIPAILLDDTIKSVLYLTAFCVTSILVMGMFAAVYGQVTASCGPKVGIYFQVFSAIVALVVGVLWLSLSLTGQLDEFLGE